MNALEIANLIFLLIQTGKLNPDATIRLNPKMGHAYLIGDKNNILIKSK